MIDRVLCLFDAVAMGGKSSTSWTAGTSGNPGGRPKGIERMTREEIEAFTWNDPELGPMTGWKALRRRAWMLAMTADAKEAIRYMQWLDARAHGVPKQSLELSGEVATTDAKPIDWSGVPIERRRELLKAALELDALGVEPGVESDATEH